MLHRGAGLSHRDAVSSRRDAGLSRCDTDCVALRHWGIGRSRGRGIIESRRNVMTIDVDAVYENGILTLKHPVDLPENAEVHVTIQTAAEAKTPLGRRLRELRAEIARSGMAPLGWDEIESEVAARRGGWREGA